MARISGQNVKLHRLEAIFRDHSNETNPLSVYDLKTKLKAYGIDAGRDTITNDIELLIELGFDIICVKGGRGKNLYYMGEREFSLSEIKMLIDSVRASKYISAHNTHKMTDKLLQIAGKDKAHIYNCIQYSKNLKKIKDNTIIYTIDDINRALTEKRMVSFRYYNYLLEGGKEYRYNSEAIEVSPVSLICNEDNYYMYAFNLADNKIKSYRVDRLDGLKVLDKPAVSNDLIKTHDSEQNRLQTFGMFGGERKTVRLKVSKKAGNYIVEEFGTTYRLIEKQGDNYIVDIDVQISPAFFGWCFSFCKDVQIIAPSIVVEQFKQHLKIVFDNYVSSLSDT